MRRHPSSGGSRCAACVRDAGGGRGGTRAQVRAYAIPGGSEEILLDLAARQAVKQLQAATAARL